jgi:hypothetical protein
MVTTHDVLIQKVFSEILKYKPSLQQVGEGGPGDEDQNDPRWLGNLIIKNYPWPIGVELRRLFSLSVKRACIDCLKQMNLIIERSLQFISFVLISQLWNEKKLNNIEIPENIRREFGERIRELNRHNYLWFIRTTGMLFEKNSTEWFIPEMKKVLDTAFFENMEGCESADNQNEEVVPRMSDIEIEACFEKTSNKLILLLQQISFMCNYKLVSVREIKVISPRYQTPKFYHYYNLLENFESEVRTMKISDCALCESHSVLLTKTPDMINKSLNLSPLILDTNSYLDNWLENLKVQKDIFMYSGCEEDQLRYSGIEATEESDFRTLQYYPLLVSQFKDLIGTISSTSVE